jgi:hypothetical protein
LLSLPKSQIEVKAKLVAGKKDFCQYFLMLHCSRN